jgi:hypothetical protein
VKGVNISVFASGSHVYSNCEYIKGYAFRSLVSGERSAHFTRFDHIVTADFASLRDNYVHFANRKDCFECLSPDKYAAA